MSPSAPPREQTCSRPRISAKTGGTVCPALLLVASGTVALIFQVLWIKQLTLIVGVDVFAVTAGISSFFGGLALGGLTLGRLADRAKRPLRLYASLEIGVALVGLAITIALPHYPSLLLRCVGVGEGVLPVRPLSCSCCGWCCVGSLVVCSGLSLSARGGGCPLQMVWMLLGATYRGVVAHTDD